VTHATELPFRGGDGGVLRGLTARADRGLYPAKYFCGPVDFFGLRDQTHGYALRGRKEAVALGQSARSSLRDPTLYCPLTPNRGQVTGRFLWIT
jgi:hypothetical protein